MGTSGNPAQYQTQDPKRAKSTDILIQQQKISTDHTAC